MTLREQMRKFDQWADYRANDTATIRRRPHTEAARQFLASYIVMLITLFLVTHAGGFAL